MKTLLALLLAVFTLLGILDAGYITYEKFSGLVPPCHTLFKCGQVLNSSWASVGGIPLSVLGLLFYGVFFGLSLAFYFGHKKIQFFKLKIPTEKLLVAQGILGVCFSMYLVFIMGVVLHAWCLYCLLSALNCFILFIISSAIYFLTKKESLYEMHV